MTDRTAGKLLDLITSLRAAKRKELAAELAGKLPDPPPEGAAPEDTTPNPVALSLERRDQ